VNPLVATLLGRSLTTGCPASRRSQVRLNLRGEPRWIALCLLLLVAACGSNEVREQPATDLPLPPSGYAGLAWLTDGTLVVADPGRLTEDATSRLLFLTEPRTGAYVAVAAKGDGCLAHEFLRPVALANGSVAFLEMCSVEYAPGYLPTEDWFLRRLEGPTDPDFPLLLNDRLDFFPGPFSVSPAMDRALASAGDSMCGSLIWVDDGLIEYPNIVIEDEDGESWNLGWFSRDTSRNSCTDQGRASWPAWAPDGTRIAFFGSPKSIGVSGQDRLNVPWNLYVIPPSAAKARPILGDITHARALAWSPDSRWLAFSGSLDGQEGVWLFDTSNNQAIAISSSEALVLAWSPAGGEIAATVPIDPDGLSLDLKVTLFDVSGIVQQN
jgi:WD40-like Beta Propeller Repeat